MSEKKAGARLGYDVTAVMVGHLPPLNVTPKERREILQAFGSKEPSQFFFAAFEYAVAAFLWYAGEVGKVTPAKVSARLKGGVQAHAHKLLNALNQLESTDHGIIDREFTMAFLADRPHISVNRFRGHLELFIQHTDAAVTDLDASPKGGRMPAYAEQALSTRIDQAINEEIGCFSSLYKNGLFAKVLIVALSMGDKRLGRNIGKPRLDVRDLMLHARNMREEVSAD